MGEKGAGRGEKAGEVALVTSLLSGLGGQGEDLGFSLSEVGSCWRVWSRRVMLCGKGVVAWLSEVLMEGLEKRPDLECCEVELPGWADGLDRGREEEEEWAVGLQRIRHD